MKINFKKILLVGSLVSLIGLSSFEGGRRLGIDQGRNNIIRILENAEKSAYGNIRHNSNNQKAWSEYWAHFGYSQEYLKGNLKFGESLK